MKGNFKKKFEYKKNKLITTDLVVVGDYVDFELNKEGFGLIYEIKERKNFLSRKAPRIKGATIKGSRLEQILAANIDNAIIVMSPTNPNFNNRTLDRYIVTSKACNIPFTIVINKIDLADDSFNYWIDLYKNTDHNIITVSATNSINIDKLKEIINNKVNIFWGPSGVGKSSLINAIYPQANLKVGEISDYTTKGKHTTVTSQLIEIDKNTYLIDSPGIREIEPFGVSKIDLSHYFNEFKKFIPKCKFNTCTHDHEPACAVRKAVEKGKISQERYLSYINLLYTIEDDINYL